MCDGSELKTVPFKFPQFSSILLTDGIGPDGGPGTPLISCVTTASCGRWEEW